MTILYVEDDEDDIFLFVKAMKEIDGTCQVIYAENDSELFKTLEVENPDILFLDFNLPGLNGIECLKKVRSMAKWRSVPIVMFSTFLNKKLVDECTRDKADLYIQKPFEFEQVVKALRDVLTNNWEQYQLPLPDKNNNVYRNDEYPKDDGYRGI